MRLRKTIILFFFVLLASGVVAQKQDTVWIQGRSILILGDSSFFVLKDTIIVIPDTVAIFLKNDTEERNNRFYRRMKRILYKYELTSELFDLLFEEPDSVRRKVKTPPSSAKEGHSKHIGKIIREVKIAKLAVFGTDISDTTNFKNSTLLTKGGNAIHNYTRSNVIRNHLFFSEGDILDPVKLEDSERTIRSLPYIKDARVMVKPINDDLVEVVVVVKDNWSLYPDMAFYNLNRWRFVLTERNFFGLGHEFVNELLYNKKDNPSFGYRGLYRIRNIGHSFITADISFAESDRYTTRGIRVYRDYVVPDIELAGGFELNTTGLYIIRVIPDSVYTFDIKYDYKDLWLSHAYPVGSAKKRKRLVTGARYISYDFQINPEVAPDSNYLYFNRDQYLFNIGISKRSYEKSSLIYGYGRTEDIPIGYLLSGTIGKEYNQFYDRWYGELKYSLGGYLGKLGYFRPSLALGSFYRNNKLEQGIVRGELSYFSYLYHLQRYALRQFFYLNYTQGFRRFGNEYIDIMDRNGIRGLESVELLGTKKLVFRSETVSFTPLYLLGFRMAIFGFVDLATVQMDNEKFFDSKIYQGYGIGFRFRNENLAFKSISVQLGYYPNAPADAAFYSMRMMGEAAYRYQDFIVEPPSVIDFR